MRLARVYGCAMQPCPLHPPGWRLEGGMSTATRDRLRFDPVGTARYRAAEAIHVVRPEHLGMAPGGRTYAEFTDSKTREEIMGSGIDYAIPPLHAGDTASARRSYPLPKLIDEPATTLHVAVLTNGVSTFSGKPYPSGGRPGGGDWASFVGVERDDVVRQAMEMNKRLGGRYTVLVGTLTQRAKAPEPTFDLVPL